MVNSVSSSSINKFDDWTNSEDNYNKAINGQDVEEYQMFDFNASTYSSDLNKFAQSYIDKYDGDKSSDMSFDEFVTMASNGQHNPQMLSVADELYSLYKGVYEQEIIPQTDADKDGSLNENEFITALGYDPNSLDVQTQKELKELFDSLNTDNTTGNENDLLSADELLVGLNPTIEGIDSNTLKLQSDMYNLYGTQYAELDLDGDGQISSGEFATMLYASDMDWENFEKTNGDVLSSIDGKLSWEGYQTNSSLNSSTQDGQNLLFQRKMFFDNFYAN